MIPRVTQCAIGERLQELRRDRELTIEEVSRASGLSSRSLRDIERGRMLPDAVQLVALATVCQTSIDFILLGQRVTSAKTDDGRVRLRTAQVEPIRRRALAVGEWVMVREAARLSGVSESDWFTRARRVSKHARRVGLKPLAVKAPIDGAGSRLVWWLHRSLDARLRLDLDAQVASDRSREFSCSNAQLDRAWRRARWLVEWRKACDRQHSGKRIKGTLAEQIVEKAKRTEGVEFGISLRSLQAWWRRYAVSGRDGRIAGLSGLIERYGKEDVP